ncbi:MAG: hypothetical protein KJN76_03415 [Eudoraea sp.]|nr:hypothetical protein [Eudoraea sp.]
MKRILFFLICLLLGLQVEAQEGVQDDLIGNVLIINSPKGSSFNHLHFPRKNFIIKRGGIANFKSVYGNRVKISAVEHLEDGSTKVYLKRTDGRKFFNFLPRVAANLELALENEELIPYDAE